MNLEKLRVRFLFVVTYFRSLYDNISVIWNRFKKYTEFFAKKKERLPMKFSLIKDSPISRLPETILFSDIILTDPVVPNLRLRGTKIETDGDIKTIMGWQRNMTRINGNLITLPTIISLSLDAAGQIFAVELHPSFLGSKGEKCARDVLDINLKKNLIGANFSRDFPKLVKVEKLFCFHLTEVLQGAYSFYRQNEHRKDTCGNNGFEVELSQGHRNNDDYIVNGIHQVGSVTIHYSIRLNDIFNKIRRSADGVILAIEGVAAEFYQEGNCLISSVLDVDVAKGQFNSYFKFLYAAAQRIRHEIARESAVPFFNSNLDPQAMIGLTIQGLSTYLGKDDPMSIARNLLGLQRAGNRPLCLGGMIGEERFLDHFGTKSEDIKYSG